MIQIKNVKHDEMPFLDIDEIKRYPRRQINPPDKLCSTNDLY